MKMNGLQRMTLIKVKVKRAKQNLMDFETALMPFHDLQSTARRTQLNRKTGKWEPIKPAVPVPIYPIDALAIAGDVIHNLRSAFDHLAYQLVCVGTGDEFPKNTGFPIADSAKAYEEEKERRKVERMPPKAVEAIDFLKPYRSGNPPLWRIHNP
jgi:hypothetical protein